MRKLVLGFGLLMAAGVCAPAFADAPFNFDTAPGRLPKDVVPTDYQVAIVPHIAAKTLSGHETVTLLVRKVTTRIVFNTLNETLSDVRLDGTPVAAVDTQNEKQLTTISLAHPATVGRHTLTMSYTGKLETAPQGLFVQPYRTPAGASGTMLSTQFESTDARRMFPCWDEPAFRSTFTLTATVPAAWAVVSNMPVATRTVHGATATTTFERSPKMPTYLVEFSAGDLARISATSGGTNFGVWAVRGQEQSGAYALANAQQILADYNAYFGVKYPLPKLDSIAVPGGFEGAMENWGAITYNDQILLLPPNSTMGRQQDVFSVQAHEMAHQWNGDLVTMGWWDDLWLNESFASWMSAKETDLRNPTWTWWEGQDDDKEGAMAADARSTSHAIEQHVTDELQAEAAFDPEITYSKGQAFLRMLEAYLGPDTFRDGVRRYIKARAYSNATSADLWNGLSAASGKDVAKVAAAWTTQPGFPLVMVAASCDAAGNRTITLSQKRFLLTGSDPAHLHWSVPMDVRSGNGTPEQVLLTQDGQTVAAGRCDEPLSANAGDIGFYRVAYDAQTLAVNQKHFGQLPDADKIAMLDDQWALVQANQAPLSSYFALASSMGTDFDARAWEQILSAIGVIERDERGTAGYDAFVAYARGLVMPVYNTLGWTSQPGETPAKGQLRRDVLRALGSVGYQPVVDEARKRFAAFVKDRSAIDADDQQMILTIVAINADQATYDQLVAVAKTAREQAEFQRYFSPLFFVKDPKLAQQSLQLVMSPAVPPQAAAFRIRFIGMLSEYHPAMAWQFFTTHSSELLSSTSEFERILILAQYVPQMFWDAVPLDQIEAWVRAHVPASTSIYIARGMESARFQSDLKARLVPATDAFVSSTSRS
ncbi:MAG TPA: M1 family metallopeptidase [Candidatus Sulfotelmatobacter sp.]|nr:M1 family metallopeptidase [Candidatus Sulfotelmatobacter sp.]